MKLIPRLLRLSGALFGYSFLVAVTWAAHWPSFRGPNGSGRAEGAAPPLKWSVTAGENIRWKTTIPGLGHSSPVLWGDRIFVTSAVKEGDRAELKVGLYGEIEPVEENLPHEWRVYCLDGNTGRVLWQKNARQGVPRIKRHPKASHANSTPAVDARYAVFFFGSEGLFCYDHDGNLVWEKDWGVLDSGFFRVPSAQWGFGSSPVIHSNRVYIQCDVQTNSFVTALDVATGKEVWRSSRTEVPTWSTPAIDIRPGRRQLILNGYKHSGGYDLDTGKELWKLTMGGDIPVPTPVVWEDLIFLTSAHGRMAPIYAVRAGASGDITLAANQTNNQFIAWSWSRRGNYMQTPIVVNNYFFGCNDAGVVSAFHARTGENVFTERLGTGGMGFTASPVSAGGKIFYTSETGKTIVINAAPTFEMIATNDLEETCLATPAIADGVIYYRTRSQLLAIGEK